MFLFVLISISLTVSSTAARWKSFPEPDFRSVVQLSSQSSLSSYREVPHHLGVLPWLVRVYALSSNGSNAAFAFEGLGSAQSDDDNSFYGGVVYGFNKNNVRIWVPSRNDGNSNGQVIWVKDGWGGELNTEESSSADIVIEAWKNGPTPAWRSTVTITAQKSSYKELRHGAKTLPDYLQVQVEATDGNNKGYVFYGMGSAQTDDDNNEYGGVIYAYDENSVRLWTAHENDGNSVGQCIFIGDGWGGEMETQRSVTCQVTVLLWIDDLPPPTFTSDWFTMQSQNSSDSYKEIHHSLGIIPGRVQVQVLAVDGLNKGFVFEGLGSAMSDDENDDYGGVVFAYNESLVRLWAPSQNDGTDRGRILFVGDGWGSERNVQMSTNAMVRVLVWTSCRDGAVAMDGGVCLRADFTSAQWKYSDFGSCSVICGKGEMNRKETHCVTTQYKTVFSCDFGKTKDNMCSFVATPFAISGTIPGWKTRVGQTVSTDTGPEYDHTDGKGYYIYSETSSVGRGQSASLTSSDIIGTDSSCTLMFYWLFFGSDIGVVTAEVLSGGQWSVVWKVNGDQELLWRLALIRLDAYSTIDKIRFVHVVGSSSSSLTNAYRGDAAIDDIELVCASTKETNTTDIGQSFCEERQYPLPGCVVPAVQMDKTGPASSTVVDGGVTYVSATGSQHDLIAQYKFNIVKDGVYLLWVQAKASDNDVNGVRVAVDKNLSDWKVGTGMNAKWQPLLSQVYNLAVGIHTVQLIQLDSNFKFSHVALIPQTLDSYAGLGLQTFIVSDNGLSATNTASECQPFAARLKSHGQNRIGWCSSSQSVMDFVQINLPEMAVVSHIATQGRQDKDEWSLQYAVKYSLDGVLFDDYTSGMNQLKIFEGNVDRDTVKMNTLGHSVLARSFRLYPRKWNGNKALRVELYGLYIIEGQCTSSWFKNLTAECSGDSACGMNGFCPRGMNGDCQCHSGFHGSHCTQNYCQPHPCLNNGTCHGLMDGYKCNCLAGFEGRICQHLCNATHFGQNCANRCNCSDRGLCDRIDGSCKCDPGYRGRHCEIECPSGWYGLSCANVCLCHNGAQCHHVTGACTCASGFQGNLCDIPCSGTTWGVDCLKPCQCRNNASCDGVTGTCRCLPGYISSDCGLTCMNSTYGLGCTSKCKCQTNALCDPFTGQCTCTAAGFTGPLCDQPCSAMFWGVDCINKCVCKNGGLCDPVNGSCDCPKGWTGNLCDKACSSMTYGRDCSLTCTCTNGAHCDRFTGACQCSLTVGCICDLGWKGGGCQVPCSQHEWGPGCRHNCTCTDKGNCNRFDGTCSCLPGYINTTCNQPCPIGQYGDRCQLNCTCDTTNTQYCRNTDGYCHCLPGHQGSDCSLLCAAGYWGQGCANKCGCKNGAECIAVDGSCLCTPGYQGTSCDIPCLEGYYGPGCTRLCQCQNGKCSVTDGSCRCDPGWQGVYCDSLCDYGYWGPSCSTKCGCNGGSCASSSGTCSCLAGYMGSQCLQICANGTWGLDCGSTCQKCTHGTGVCDHETGHCPCPVGYKGATCSQACPTGKHGSNCLSDCHCVNGLCDPRTGHCSCSAGYTGQNCTETCASGLYGKHCSLTCSCVYGLCNPVDGGCMCYPGYVGVYCDQSCQLGMFGDDCLKRCGCVHSSKCNHTNGVCDCDPGWIGKNCDQACPALTYGKNCHQTCACHNGAQCDRITGDCLCTNGWTGPSCLQACPIGFFGQNCSERCRCTSGSGCHHITGQCQCPPGYMGAACDIACQSGYHGSDCLLQCECDPLNTLTSTVCDPISGICYCQPGYTGSCRQVCPQNTFGFNCSSSCLCENGGYCHHVSGACTCTAGYLGPFCNETCSNRTFGLNCLNACNCVYENSAWCDNRNGQCYCLPGYNGTLCEQKCPAFFYGPYCTSECTNCLSGHSSGCHGATGECLCDRGWSGKHCDTVCPNGLYGPGCQNICHCANGAQCDRFDGSCKCMKGYTGRYCTQVCSGFMFGTDCSENCDCVLNNTASCHHINGSCYCKPGFQGSRCHEGCEDGYWSSGCVKQCPVCSPHIAGYCNKDDGSCTCLPGYQNYFCTSDCPLPSYGHGCFSPCQECSDGYLCNHIHGQCQYIKDAEFWIDFAVPYDQAQSDSFQLQVKLALSEAFSLYAPLEIDLDDLVIAPGVHDSNATFSYHDIGSLHKFPGQQVMDYNKDYVGRIVHIDLPHQNQGQTLIRITFIMLYKNRPMKGQKSVNILQPIPEDRLKQFFLVAIDFIGRPATKAVGGEEGVPVLPIVIGSVCGFLVIVTLLCLGLWKCRTKKRRTHGPTYVYHAKQKKNPNPLTSSQSLWSTHRNTPQTAACGNLCFDILTALEIEDELEHTFENPVYEHSFHDQPKDRPRSSLYEIPDTVNDPSGDTPNFSLFDKLEISPHSDLPEVICKLESSHFNLDRPVSSPDPVTS